MSCEQLGDQPLLVAARQPDLGLHQQPARDALDLGAALGVVQALELGQVELGDELAVELLLDDLEAVGLGLARTARRAAGRACAPPLACLAAETLTEIHDGLPPSEEARRAGSPRRSLLGRRGRRPDSSDRHELVREGGEVAPRPSLGTAPPHSGLPMLMAWLTAA